MDVSFSDKGCGIGGGELNKIFNPFYSGREGGSGLGLAIVHRIVEMHQGEVLVESEEGKGSSFTVRFPVDPPGGGEIPSPKP